MIKLYSPRDDGELALLRSVLDAAEIPYFVQNDHFGSLGVGPRVDLLNVKTVMVPEEVLEQAHELVADYLRATAPLVTKKSIGDKVRMILELLFLQWFVPGRRTRRTETDDDTDAA